MKKMILAAAALGLLLVQQGCAMTPKVAVSQMGDDKLTCAQLQDEYTKLDVIDKKADDNKSVNTTNVAAALFFWPAVVATVMSADDAQKHADERRSRLVEIAKPKGW